MRVAAHRGADRPYPEPPVTAVGQDPDLVERVRAASDIVEVVGQTVQLRRAGRNWVGLCPFHQEKTPSFSVGPDLQLYHCFGCGAGGDVFRFVEEIHKVGFLEAMGMLARRAGVPVPETAARPQDRTPRRLRSGKPEPSRPPRAEVHRLWDHCRPVVEDEDVARWLATRGLDPLAIAARDLARALPPTGLPAWARFRRADWHQSGHRCLVPLHSATGTIESVTVRAVRCDINPKGLFPAGYGIGSLIMANAAARRMLESSLLAAPLSIFEGVPDYLRAASGCSNEGVTAVVSIVAGSWTAEIAARVPIGARLIVAVHHDEAGARYARAIVRTLQGRATLERCIPPWGQA